MDRNLKPELVVMIYLLFKGASKFCMMIYGILKGDCSIDLECTGRFGGLAAIVR